MTDEARSSPKALAAKSEERPSGLPAQKSAARMKTPVPDEPASGEPARRAKRSDETPLRVLRPPREGSATQAAPESAPERPPGLTNMTTSARLRLQLVLDDEERPRIESAPPAPDPKKPPAVKAAQAPAFDPADLRVVRSLGRWIGLCGLMTLTVGALTGLSYFTGEGKVAHVVVGILASALATWLIAAAVSFHRAAGQGGKFTHHLVSGFGVLRSAFLLKAVLLFAAMALGCFTFSLVASLLFLL